MTFTVGGVDVAAVHVGATPAQAVYLGSKKVWPVGGTAPGNDYYEYEVVPSVTGAGQMAYADTAHYLLHEHDQWGRDFRQHVLDNGGGSDPHGVLYRIWLASTGHLVYQQSPSGQQQYPQDGTIWRLRVVTAALSPPRISIGDRVYIAFGNYGIPTTAPAP